MPYLGGVGDAMPDRVAGFALEQIIDFGAGGAVAGDLVGVLKGLAVVALFDVGGEVELLDHVLGRVVVDGGGEGGKDCGCGREDGEQHDDEDWRW